MINHRQHIIAHCNWDTSFDSKEQGVQLQDMISHWSHYHLSRELTPLFNEICPEGQTLKINTLEVDLGIIEYQDLQDDLPLKLKSVLYQKLQDIIKYPHMHGQGLEVIHEDISFIESLKYFLLQGIKPWSYATASTGIHELFTDQITHNHTALMDMITAVGVHQYVRKRIAWQLKEPIIKKIIESIEPSNHRQIFTFSEELTNIQKKETVVKTSLQDFKKNLWFWVLNYLFIERGSMFNKMAFVKSNIQQMANHFNIEYYTLFELIEDAIHNIYGNTSIKNDFILILIALSKEQHKISNVPITEKQIENDWKLLHSFLKNPLSRKNTQYKNRCNDLIVHFSKTSLSRLKKMFFSLRIPSSIWLNVLKEVSPSVRETIFRVIAPEKATSVIEQIYFFEALKIPQKFTNTAFGIWGIGVQFLLGNNTKTVSKDAFIKTTIEKLSTTASLSKIEVLEKLLHTEIAQPDKTVKTITIYKTLKTMYIDEITKGHPSYSKEHFVIVLQRLSEALRDHSIPQTVSEEFQKYTSYWLKKNPTAVWDMLSTFPDREQIISYISLVMSTQEIETFLKSIHNEKVQFLYDFYNSVELALHKTISNAQTLTIIKSSIKRIGFEVIINNKKATFIQFITQVIIQLRVQEEIGTVLDFAKAISEISPFLFQRIQNTSLKQLLKNEQDLFLEKTDSIAQLTFAIKKSPSKQLYVARLLKKVLFEKTIEIGKNQLLLHKINSYLLPAHTLDVQEYVEQYVHIYTSKKGTQSTKAIREILIYLYLNCLTDYQLYRGDITRFDQVYLKAIQYRFEELRSITTSRRVQKEKRAPFIHSEAFAKLSEEGVYTYIKRSLISSALYIEIDKKKVAFNTLIKLGLEQSPERIRDLIKNLSITKSQQEVFIKTIDFEQFITLVSSDIKDQVASQFYIATRSLYYLLLEINVKQSTTNITYHFWEQLMMLLKSEKTHTEVLKELSKYTLEILSKESEMSTAYLIKFSKDRNIAIPEILKKNLLKENKAFEKLPVTISENKVSKDIEYCLSMGSLEELYLYIIYYHKIPSWFYTTHYIRPSVLLQDIVTQYPLQLLGVLRKNTITQSQYTWLYKVINFTNFISSLGKLYPKQQQQFNALKEFYAVLKEVRIQSIPTSKIHHILFGQLLYAWKESNWKLISSTSIWKELIWELCAKSNAKKESFFEAIQAIKIRLPTTLQITYNQLYTNQSTITSNIKKEHITKDNSMSAQQDSTSLLDQGITIHNAGLVIMNTYISMLFDRLGLTDKNAFVSEESQVDAVHYLQYLVTGLSQTEESLLVLNKVICGISIQTPIKDGIEISKDHEALIQGLIEAAIGYWPAIGECSIDGFRGNWLVREGILREEPDRWTLTVEKRAYDILMLKSPFSFSIIKLPWMIKPLHITWSF